jgi:hypothetical protein
MSQQRDRSRERRWIVLGEDGRFVTLGRESDPAEEEIQAAARSMSAQGLPGWLAIMEGNPYESEFLRFLEVERFGEPVVTFEAAAAACRDGIIRRS